MLPLLVRSVLTDKTSASACQHSSAVKGGPIAALHRTLCPLFGAPLESHIHLHFIHPSQHWSSIKEPTGFLCKMSLRLLSSSLRLFFNMLKSVSQPFINVKGAFINPERFLNDSFSPYFSLYTSFTSCTRYPLLRSISSIISKVSSLSASTL